MTTVYIRELIDRIEAHAGGEPLPPELEREVEEFITEYQQLCIHDLQPVHGLPWRVDGEGYQCSQCGEYRNP